MTASTRRPAMRKRKTDHHEVLMVHVSTLKPSPENSLLYRERNINKSDRQRLVKSILKMKGVQAPLLVSRDDYIVSGHERHAASPDAGYPMVPIIVLDLLRSDHTADEWLAVLREHNTGRDKTLDEKIREKMVDVAIVETAGQVADSLVTQSDIKSATIYIPAKKKTRSAITKQTRGFASPEVSELFEGRLQKVVKGKKSLRDLWCWKVIDKTAHTDQGGISSEAPFGQDGRQVGPSPAAD